MALVDDLRPYRMLRWAGAAMICLVGCFLVIDTHYKGSDQIAREIGDPRAAPFAARATIGIVAAAVSGLLALFWTTIRRVEKSRTGWLTTLLICAQALVAFGVQTDLIYLVCIQIPLAVRPKVAWTWFLLQTAAILAAVFGLPGLEPDPALAHTPRPLARALTLVSFAGWCLLAFCAGYLIRRAELGRDNLSRINEQLRGAQTLLAGTSRLAERLRISRELHDAVGHHLAGLNVNLELASYLAKGPAAEPVGRARLIARLLLTEVREVVSSLREQQGIDLAAALENLKRDVITPAIHLDIPSEPLARAESAHVLFRCAQEAATNASKHGGAGNLWIKLSRSGGSVAMQVRDDGRGAQEWRRGNGLNGIEERVKELGGHLSLTSAAGRGFSMEVRLPDPGDDA